MVYRVYVEKKAELAAEASALASDLQNLLQIKGLESVRIFNRYDVDNITKELFDYSVKTILSEPQLDIVTEELPVSGNCFAVEYLPGQFDQRADSAAQCIQILSRGERPLVRTAKIYVLSGHVSGEELLAIKKYVINPVESREASFEAVDTLKVEYDIPKSVRSIIGFCAMHDEDLEQMTEDYGLAMDTDDLRLCQTYFRSEHRDPTMTELRVIDTYWSDHCRHTTFLTTIDHAEFEDELLQKTYEDYLETRKAIGRTKPINLMDLGTIAGKFLKKQGKLENLDESEEINACTVKIKVNTDE
ncbi:MAG: phosphoribosylformylglycinamidine synthase, partial [Evtepia sp.]